MRKKRRLFLFFLVFLFGNSLSAIAGQLGVGISLPERGGTMVDQVREQYRWTKAGGAELTTSDVDASGWPKVDCRYIKDWRPVAEWIGVIDDPNEYRVDMSGVYKCSFTGQATLSKIDGDYTISNKIYNQGSNTTTFDLTVDPPGSGHGLLVLEFINTKRTSTSDTGTGITNFRMTRPGYPHDTRQIFTTGFINTLTSADFSTIRFMDFRHTNNSEPSYPEVTEWSHRKLTTDAGQGPIEPLGKLDGAAWEYVIELGNLVNMDIWINVQLSATTDYVTQLATLIKNTLNANLNVYVESSNEVWNSLFNQYNYNNAQANELDIGEHENHARRTIELAQIFEGVFGVGSINDRIRVMLCSHAPMLKWWVEPMLQYIDTTFGPPNNFIYAIARQTYFAAEDRFGNVEQLLDGCHEDISNQISETTGNQAGRKQWIEKAADWNLVGGTCSYEGGFHIPSGGSTTNLANQINMHRVERASTELKYNFGEAFFALGGNLAIQFTLTSGYNRYGCWGLTDDVNKPDRNYKFQAIRDIIQKLNYVDDTRETPPYEVRLFQNYPNPFNPETEIRFQLPFASHVKLVIYNIYGQPIRVIANKKYTAGPHSVRWDGRNMCGNPVSSGIYFYYIQTGKFSQVKKITLLH